MKFYVYKIYNKIVDKYYVGSRTISESIDILKGYNTSSKVVKNLIKEYGIESFEITSIILCDSVEQAIQKENEILQSIDCREKYLNINFSAGGAVIKSQTHVQIYNNDKNEYMYHPKNLEIPNGWIKKSSFKPPSRKGFKLIINVETLETKFTNINTDTIESPWCLKVEYDKELHSKKEKCTVWITDGLINKKIKKSETCPDGWRLGKIAKRSKNIKITNGTIDRYFNPLEKIPDGWYKGQSKKGNVTTKNTKTINNGINNKHINIDDQIPKGWKIGQVPNSQNKIYYIDDKIFYFKKDVMAYLNMTPAKFDYAIKKNKLKIIIEERK